jgi:hypothetical protein
VILGYSTTNPQRVYSKAQYLATPESSEHLTSTLLDLEDQKLSSSLRRFSNVAQIEQYLHLTKKNAGDLIRDYQLSSHYVQLGWFGKSGYITIKEYGSAIYTVNLSLGAPYQPFRVRLDL